MSSWRTNRKIFYLLIVSGLFFGIFTFIYVAFIHKPASCFDNRQNLGEIGVDCGSPCDRVCPLEVTPIIQHWARFFKVNDRKYDTAALIENPNFGFGLKNMSYTFTLYDSDNHVIVSKTDSTFVNPRESFILFQNG